MAHLTLLLVLLWVGTTVSTEVDVAKRVIGGRDCTRDERPYHVKLTISNDTHTSHCGGNLINNQWVLTVAHCWMPGCKISFKFRNHPRPTEAVEITSKPVPLPGHDIMLLKFNKPLEAWAKPIELGDCNEKYQPGKESKVEIAGHASTVKGPNNERICRYTPTLQCAEVKVVDCDYIDDILVKTKSTDKHWFCGKAPGVDACLGDSGGGVVYKDRLYGLISHVGIKATEKTIKFVDICHPEFAEWIKTTAPRQ